MGDAKTSKKLITLNDKRNNKVEHYIHTENRLLVNELVSLGVSKVIIGKNKNWKQEINIGKSSPIEAYPSQISL